MTCVFDRLYVLQKHIINCSANRSGTVIRPQVTDGAEILGFLLRVFVGLMMNNRTEGWGRSY